mgnify:CR=1 FL=1
MSETASEIAVLRAALAAAEARASAAEGALVAAKGELTQVQAIVSASCRVYGLSVPFCGAPAVVMPITGMVPSAL